MEGHNVSLRLNSIDTCKVYYVYLNSGSVRHFNVPFVRCEHLSWMSKNVPRLRGRTILRTINRLAFVIQFKKVTIEWLWARNCLLGSLGCFLCMLSLASFNHYFISFVLHVMMLNPSVSSSFFQSPSLSPVIPSE